jgi:hypothetical protein
VIHVALVSAYPTEAEARAALSDGNNYAPGYRAFAGSDAPYLGVWRLAEPYGAEVHVFTALAADQLEAHGWTREGTP